MTGRTKLAGKLFSQETRLLVAQKKKTGLARTLSPWTGSCGGKPFRVPQSVVFCGVTFLAVRHGARFCGGWQPPPEQRPPGPKTETLLFRILVKRGLGLQG